MSPYCVYLTLPPYLAQWYAYKCWEHNYELTDVAPEFPIDTMKPVPPIKDSQEARILRQFLTKQPGTRPEDEKEGANLCIAIPYFKERDPRYNNYLGVHGKQMLIDSIRNAFRIDLWETLHNFEVRLDRQDEAIWCYMENNYIDLTETNWNAIAKTYKRMRDVYKAQKNRKNRTDLSKQN